MAKTKIVDAFDDFGALLHHVTDTPAKWTTGTQSHDNSDYYERWSASKSFDEAIALARQGWPDGRGRLATGLQANAIFQERTGRGATLDVGGSFPVVPLFVAGEPAHMVTFGEDVRARRPIVQFSLQRFVSAGVPTDNIMNQGLAILSHVDQLENDGLSCEIEATMNCDAEGFTYQIKWCVKRAGEPLELDRLAFIIGHPSLFRRVLFACYERHGEPGFEAAFAWGYGSPATSPEIEPGQIYFEQPSDECWRQMNTALAAVGERIRVWREKVDDPLLNWKPGDPIG